MTQNKALLQWLDNKGKRYFRPVSRNLFFLVAGIILFTFSSSLYAQQQPQFDWAKQTGGHRTDKGNSVAVDAWGNVYTAGQFFDTADFNPGGAPKEIISNGGWDMFLTKRDKSGNLIWVKTVGSSGMDVGSQIVIDDSGNVYMTGNFSHTVDFNPGGAAINLTAQGYFDVFVAKFDSSGNTIWAKGMGGAQVNDSHSLSLDGNGNVYVTGAFQDSGDFSSGQGTAILTSNGDKDVFIAKLTTNGRFVWAKNIGGSGEDIAFGIAAAPSGNIYITGHFNDTVDFDPGSGTTKLISNEKQDMFVAKYDSTGALDWVGRIAGASFTEWQWEYAYGIALDASENVYTTGEFSGTVDFDPDPANVENLNSTLNSDDAFLLKLDSSGKYVWAKNMGGRSVDVGNSVFCNALGDVYLTGYFNDIVDFDPGSGTDSLTSFGGMDVFAAKFDSAGNFQWVQQFGGKGSYEEGYSIVTDVHNNVYLAGYFEDAADFDPGSNVTTLTSNGNEDAFTVKLSDCISVDYPFVINGSDSICPGSTDTYVVTGVPGATSYTWTLPQGATGSSTSDSIIVTFGSQAGTIYVTANGLCDTGKAQLTVNLSMAHPVINVDGFTLSTMVAYDTYQWLLNNNIIPGATSRDYTVTQNGDYRVIVSNQVCTDTSDTYTVTNAGINDAGSWAKEIQVYPNPAQGWVHISSPHPVDVALTDIAGKVIRKDGNAQGISVKGLANGLYLLRIMNKDGALIKVEKVVKQE